MYLRTTKRKNKDGSHVVYYQLAHNERNPATGQTTAKVIHNFGRADQLDREALARLCHSIARVCGLNVIDAPSDPLEGLTIDRSYNYGHIYAIEQMWERFGIGAVLRDIEKTKHLEVSYERALFVMVANRLCEPLSKLGLWERWLDKVYLPECREVKLRQLYQAMDVLHESIEEIEKAVFYKTANLFNLEVDLIFYDTTTVSFSVDPYDLDEDDVRAFGHSKEGHWAPQVIVALAVTREGLPVKSWVFRGNTADVSTITQIRSDLRGWNLGRALFVSDSAMNSEENRKELSRACGKYVMATRMASVKEVKEEVLSRKGRYTVVRDNMHVKEVVVGEGECRRRYFLCFNPSEARRQQLHRAEVIEFLEQELSRHKHLDAKARWAIDLLASHRYRRYLKVTKGGKIRLNKAAIRQAERYDGKWVLQTNDDTIGMEEAASSYKGLLAIERCFRTLKRTQIKISPVHHYKYERIVAHVKICVLSLLLERSMELLCGESWLRIKTELETLQVTRFETEKNSIFYRRNRPSQWAKSLLSRMQIPVPKEIIGIQA